MGNDSIRVLAVTLGGGNGEQLKVLRPTLTRYDLRFATNETAVAAQFGIWNAGRLPDCTQEKPFRSAHCAV
jgi:hypothetical protein